MVDGYSASRGALRRAFSLRKNSVPLLIAALCLLILYQKLDGTDAGALALSLGRVEPWQWAGACLATALSFLAVGQYDTLFHGWLRTGVKPGRAFRAGTSAIALAQTLGFGLATGTFARWRALPELSFGTALKLTHCVSFSFMGALGIIVAAVLAAGGQPWAWGVAAIALVGIGAAAALSLFRPVWCPVVLPPLGLMTKLVLLTAADLVFMACAFYILVPAETGLPFWPLFRAFVIALGAGLVLGTPGGVGPFELTLIALLPMVPETELVAAVVAFRLVYFALPACLGALVLARPSAAAPAEPRHPAPAAPQLRAEATGLAHLPGHELAWQSGRALHMAEASQTLVTIGDPATGGVLQPGDLRAATDAARERGLFPSLYKIGARSAAVARSAGWSVLLISEDASIDPASFNTDGASRRQLRRNLGKAEKAAVHIVEVTDLPINEMASVARDWAERCGGERGFSMGRFDRDHVGRQKCFLAYRDGDLTAFVTFHVTADEWALDLMRDRRGSGQGTMHALIVAAIRAARERGVARVSLAAMPLANPPALLNRAQDMDGLRRFKLSFAPDVSPLYLAAPAPHLLALAGADILLRIRSPETPTGNPVALAMQWMQSRFSETSVVPLAVSAHLSHERETHVTRR